MRSQIAKYCQMDEAAISKILDEQGLGLSYEKGLIDSRTLFHSLPPNIQGKGGFAGWFDAISGAFEPNSTINPLLKDLKKGGVAIFVCSNICEAHFDYIYTHFSALHLFDGYILSYEVKAQKPEERMYSLALEKTKTPKDKALFIEGRQDCAEKARLLGFDSEYYTDTHALRNILQQKGLLS